MTKSDLFERLSEVATEEQVEKALPAMVEFVENWLYGLRLRQISDRASDDITALWKLEMSGRWR